MISELYGWVKNIAFYLILVTAVMHLIPNQAYKKYVNLFTGMILIVLVLAPVGKILEVNTRFDTSFINQIYNQELSTLNMDSLEVSTESTNEIFNQYKTEITKQVEQLVKKEGYYMVSADIVMNEERESEDFGKLESIDVTLSTEEGENIKVAVDKISVGQSNIENSEEISVKNVIDNFYNLGLDNINVSIQR